MGQSTIYGSQGAGASMASLQTYTFDLRSGLAEAAKAGLNQLEDMMNDIGYGWLDGYMEGVMERTSRGPITELMKTPSRTHTVKKTRANTAALKDRTDKVKGLNARMNGSPVSKASPVRQPFSPLQPRSLNAAPPQFTLSLSPLKAKAATPVKKSSKSQKEKKKGKSKQADENAPVTSSQSSIGKSQQRDEPMPEATDVLTPNKSASTRSRDAVVVEIPTKYVSTPSVKTPKPQREPAPAREPEPGAEPDVTVVIEAVEDVSDPEPEIEDMVVEMEQLDSEIAEETNFASPFESVAAIELPKAETQSTSAIPNPVSPDSIPLPRSQAPPQQVPTGAAVPVRQVRSSWLSKALGTGTVPITGLPNSRLSTDAIAMRKSFAAPSSSRINNTVDFTMRKSFAPAGGFGAGIKRQSEDAIEDDKRLEKVAKIDLNQTQILPSRKESLHKSGSSTISHTPGPATIPISHTPAPILPTQPDSVGQPAQSRGDRGRSDIHKVTKALDELRERAAAKEAAKQKAALASSTGPRHTASAELRSSTAGGSGFFKGLGSLGMGLGRSLGLGGTARSAEEEALRLQQELEEERREELEAQAKLDQLIAEVDRPITPSPADDGHEAVDDHGEFDSKDLISSTPFVPRNLRAAEDMETEAEEEEEVAEELDELMEEVEEPPAPVSKPVAVTTLPIPIPARSPLRPRPEPRIMARQTPPRQFQDIFAASTTPTATPPRVRQPFVVDAPALQARTEKHDRPEGVRPIQKAEHTLQAESTVKPVEREINHSAQHKAVHSLKASTIQPASAPAHEEEEEEEEEDLPELPEPEADDERTDTEDEGEGDDEEDVNEMPAKKMFKSDRDVIPKSVGRLPSATSSSNLASSQLNASTSSQMFGHASTIAGKTLGFKPTTGPVKSLQLAAAAAKKEQAAIDRKVQLREQAEQRKAEAARKKAEEDRIKAEEDKKIRAAELEEKRRIRLEGEKRRKEREEKIAMIAREKAAKEEAEKAAAKAKAEEEANKKRKLAQAALNRSTNAPSKKIAQPATNPPLRTIKPTVALVSSTNGNTTKMGPTVFRTAAETQTHMTASTSTISLVQATTTQQQQPIRQLGQPSRLSQQPTTGQASRASNVLQQSRVALQSALDEKALEIASEEIVLPDIASEYSDSDDSDKETDFKRPAWAESPELRAALAEQASRNPDELFGPIKPLNMEELFKQRTHKFRARTSSANWNGGDRLTRAEEIEYARRMGFKAMPSSGLGSGL